ncbi:MAG TPA: ATP-binding protein [Burkholderiaceae bacterium]|nr:ATP-binding protein [Burkholderiaceae bacterium]
MKSLYLRIYLTVVVALALFAIGSTWLFQRQVDMERGRFDAQVSERVGAWAELIQRTLPAADAPREEQADALREWAQRLRWAIALDDANGERIAASELYLRRSSELPGSPRGTPVKLDDGRTLWVLRGQLQGMRARGAPPGGPPGMMSPWPRGAGLVALLLVLFLAVAVGAFPVVRRLTRRLENLKQGVQRFGEGELAQRVDASGRDEVAAVAASFNQAAGRIEALVASHKNLLANASHELRSPLARMKMALSLLDEQPDPAQRERLAKEIRTNIGELDALVEEVLLASRLDAQAVNFTPVPVEVVSLAAEEAARFGAELQTQASELTVPGDERLLRRALRNLLENARRYGASEGGGEITLHAARLGALLELRVCDRGPGVPEALRERIFEPFFRLPGHAEREGGVGLGLALVKQIAQRHGGSVRCEPHLGGGSCFVLSLPAQA